MIIISDNNTSFLLGLQMNLTRTEWSKLLGCYISEPNAELPLIISVILIAITPLVFYGTAKRFSAKAETRLQRRE
jgi:hypothetical protein